MTHTSLMQNYSPMDIAFLNGQGVWLTDEQGEKYLDALSGIAVCGLGHAHPKVAEAIADQAQKLVHTSNLYRIDLQEKLASRLCHLAKMDRVFFSNSGAEANEAAIKLARLHGRQKGIQQPTVLVMQGSFHGRTLATLSATGNAKVQQGFEPLVAGFTHVAYNQIEELQKQVEQNPNIVAIFCEPIQGEGGVNIPDADYLSSIRQICDQHDLLMILDEVQTGVGRTGEWFAFQHENITPDVMTLAKALGNGVPIGACVAKGHAADLFTPGSHGSTYGGNPLVCRAALSVLETIEEQDLLKQSQQRGHYLLEQFNQTIGDLAGLVEIRGKGLMIGIELDRDCSELVSAALEQKLLINVTAANTIRLLPALIISQDECDQLVTTLSPLIRSFLQK